MLTDQEKKALLHFTHSPSVFNDNRLKSLASSITNGRITPASREDAVKCLLLHAESLDSILNSKKVTAAVLLKYLNELNVPAPGNSTKETLIHRILYSEWNFPLPSSSQGITVGINGRTDAILSTQSSPACGSSQDTYMLSTMNPPMNNLSNVYNIPTNNPMHINQPSNSTSVPYQYSQFNSQGMNISPSIPFANSGQNSVVSCSGQNSAMLPQSSIQQNNCLQMHNNPLRSSTSSYSETIASHQLLKEVNSLAFDEFMVSFAKMFYDLFNNPAGSFHHALNQSHFFDECKMMIQIKGGEEDIEQSAESVIEVLKLLSDLRQEHQLVFNPNLTPEGVRGKTDSHGLIYAVASGTLHHGRGKLVGVYEQSFILRKDPFEQNSCKIADSTLILRSNNSVNSFSQLLLPTSSRNNERHLAIQGAPSSGNQLQLTYHS